MLGVHRPDFQRVLLAHLARRCRTHTAKRLASYTDSDAGALRLHFADGTRAACDVLVGADGIRSAVRACMLERTAAARRAQGDAGGADAALRGVRARWSGTMAYRATVPADALRARFPGHRVLAAPHVVSAALRWCAARSLLMPWEAVSGQELGASLALDVRARACVLMRGARR